MMTYKIPYRDWLDKVHDKIDVDQQTSIDHEACPAGRDTRQRLYIKRTGHDSYICHCFNCGGSGYYFGSAVKRIEDSLGHRRPVTMMSNREEAQKIYDEATDELPLHVEKYLLDYYVTKEEAVKNLCYRWHREMDGLCMPLYQDVRPAHHAIVPLRHSVERMQVRSMHMVPKSRYTYFGVPKYAFGLVAPTRSIQPTIFIVEDQISAYRVARDSGKTADALALLGTNMAADAAECLRLRAHKKVVVWLDHDSAGQKGASEIVRTLTPILGADRVYYLLKAQPKDLGVEELKRECARYG